MIFLSEASQIQSPPKPLRGHEVGAAAVSATNTRPLRRHPFNSGFGRSGLEPEAGAGLCRIKSAPVNPSAKGETKVPKSAKLKEDDGKVHAAKPMGDGEKLRGFLDRIAEVQASIDVKMAKAVLACEADRQDLKEIKKEANEAGFPAREFNTLVRKERLEAKLKNIDENLDDEQKERFEDMLDKLGVLAGTPLGDHAIAGHPEARPN